MPLPTAPSKRASLLSLKDLEFPAAKPREITDRTRTTPDMAPMPGLVMAHLPTLDVITTWPSSPDPAALIEVKAPAKLDDLPSRPSTKPAQRPRRKVKLSQGPAKLFVLDTNVLLHDPTCLFRFEEHDIFLPMIVLEELDAHKKGMTEVARNGRQTSRSLDALAEHQGADITSGLPLNSTGHTQARGRLFFQTQLLNYDLPLSLPQGKADPQPVTQCQC